MSAFDWRAFDAYLFDIDGTLVNARDGVHYNSFHSALRKIYGCDGPIDPVPLHGNTDIGILRAALRHYGMLPDDFEARLPAALELMCSEVAGNAAQMQVEVCPCIADVLSELRAAGKLLGVVTGNLEQIGWRKLQRAGLRRFFDFGSFSDRREKRADIFRHGIEAAHALRGPHSTVCFVGDTPHDIAAAAQLGAPIIAVATGIYLPAELQKFGPDLCVGSCVELLSES